MKRDADRCHCQLALLAAGKKRSDISLPEVFAERFVRLRLNTEAARLAAEARCSSSNLGGLQLNRRDICEGAAEDAEPWRVLAKGSCVSVSPPTRHLF